MAKKKTYHQISCVLRELPKIQLLNAAEIAVAENPMNAPMLSFGKGSEVQVATPQQLAVMTGKYWSSAGKVISVGFLDSPNEATKRLILQYANLWYDEARCNIRFVPTNTDPMVRLARLPNDGYWSYLGTDILSIHGGQATMNLAGFTDRTSAAEYRRVVPHEFGHTMGFPHEHLRPEFVSNIDVQKAIAYFRNNYGWSEAMTRANVLTALDVRSIMGSTPSDPVSIMAYTLPGSIMKDGRPVVGGNDISPIDKMFATQIYPLGVTPPPPPPPPAVYEIVLQSMTPIKVKEIP